MSEHDWTQEQLAAYLAGGLEPAERGRLERHLGECADCGRALAAARIADDRLLALFADIQPGPLLEKHMVRKLRADRRFARKFMTPWVKVVLATAAVALITASGAVVSQVMDEYQAGGEESQAVVAITTRWPREFDRLPTTGEGRSSDHFPVRSVNLIVTDSSESMSSTVGSETLAARLREQALRSLGREPQGSEKSEKRAPFLAMDGDPAKQEIDTDIQYMTERKADVSVPGSVNPNQAVGIKDVGGKASQVIGLGTGAMASMRKSWTAPPVPPASKSSAAAPSVPGTVNPNQAVGIKDEEGRSPRTHYSPSGGIVAGKADVEKAKEWSERVGADSAAQKGKPPREPEEAGKSDLLDSSITPLRPQLLYEKKSAEKVDKLLQPKKDLVVELAPEPTAPAQSKPPGADPVKPGQPAPAEPAPTTKRYVIRTGEIEFVVDSFDEAVAEIQKLVAASKGGYIATINSDKLVNGKVRGAVVVRVPPEQLDKLVLDLRRELAKHGELKGQRIGSEDVSKLYTDLESRLRAARTMQDRLLRIIKDGKGEIKDLVVAEKELGVWNTKTEELEGELRYYANRIGLSTLTITLAEKEIHVAATVVQFERVQAGIEVDDVEKAMREVLTAVEAAKGRITRSELKQHSAGQFSAQLEFEVGPDQAGPVRDRLNQLGTVVRLDIDRVQTAQGGDKLPTGGRTERGNTHFNLSLYNLASVAPRETVTLKLAAVDVVAAYRSLREALLKTGARVITANLQETDRQNITGQLDFDLKRADDGIVQTALANAGDIVTRQSARAAESANVTEKKLAYKVELIPAAGLEPREVVAIAIEVGDVEAALGVLGAQVKELHGRVVKDPDVADEPNGNVIATVIYEVPLLAAPAFAEKLRHTGVVHGKRSVPNPRAPEGKLALVRFNVTLTNGPLLVPRDESLWTQMRTGLSYSIRGLGWLLVGVLFLLPWALVVGAVAWVVMRVGRVRGVAENPASPTSTNPPAG